MNNPPTYPAPVTPLFAPYTPPAWPRHIVQESGGAWRIIDTLFGQAIDGLGLHASADAAAEVLGRFRAELVRRFGLGVL